MTAKGNRRNGQPIFIKDDIAKGLQRIPLDAKAFNEDWIQKLIYNNPDILPINELETGFAPAIAIGREVSTAAGYIDNLFISPDGYLTIIETKLWRNPEARREVVGQILDYAKELNKWTFTNLDNSVKQFNSLYNNNNDGLLATVRKHTDLEETEEQYFIDNVNKNLKRGRFLLLIVGDGIRESVEEMVDYLTQTPQLYFTLALIELQVYKFQSDNSLIVIPQLVTRTREVIRAVVKIEGNYSSDIKVNIETDLNTESTKQKQNLRQLSTVISMDDFFALLAKKYDVEMLDFVRQIIKESEEIGLVVEWNSLSFSIKFPDPQGSGVKISIIVFDKVGWFYLRPSEVAFKKLQIPVEISYKFAEETARILNIQCNSEIKSTWKSYPSIENLKPVFNQFMASLKKYIDEIRKEGQNKS